MRITEDNSNLLRYTGEIECGNIIVGNEMYRELVRLREDIKSEAYVYNMDDANFRFAFMEGCIRLTKSPFYGKPMVLMLWQKAFTEAFLSFKMPEEWAKGIRIDRFKRSLLMIGRKNAKSETVSALVNAEFICGNEGADLVCSSNDDAQASIVYDAVDTMRQMYDPRDVDTKRNQRFILNRATNTKIFKLSDRTRNKEGRVCRLSEFRKVG